MTDLEQRIRETVDRVSRIGLSPELPILSVAEAQHLLGRLDVLQAEVNGAKQAESACRRERDEARRDRAEVAEENERCHGLLDKARGLGGDNTVSAETLEVRLAGFIGDCVAEVDEVMKARDASQAKERELSAALEACGYWLHPAGFNGERQRLFDRITNAVANSHSLWNFIKATLGNNHPKEKR